MAKDINDFVTIVQYKNGNATVVRGSMNETNIYKLLREMGYCKVKNKKMFYKREKFKLTPLHFSDVIQAFIQFVKTEEFINFPNNVSRKDIVDWIHSKRPIRQNNLLDHYLEENLSENQIKSLSDNKVFGSI